MLPGIEQWRTVVDVVLVDVGSILWKEGGKEGGKEGREGVRERRERREGGRERERQEGICTKST